MPDACTNLPEDPQPSFTIWGLGEVFSDDMEDHFGTYYKFSRVENPDEQSAVPNPDTPCAPQTPANFSELLPGLFVFVLEGKGSISNSGPLDSPSIWGAKTTYAEVVPEALAADSDRVSFQIDHTPGVCTIIRNDVSSTANLLSRPLIGDSTETVRPIPPGDQIVYLPDGTLGPQVLKIPTLSVLGLYLLTTLLVFIALKFLR